LYKLGKLEEATSILASAGIHTRGLSHVAAQVAYRAERFDETLSIYNRLLASDPEQEKNDVGINMQAAQAQAEWMGVSLPSGPESKKAPETFELCYNSACANIAKGSWQIASKLLQRALALCDASDELTEAEKEEERKPIVVQQAFVMAKLGNVDHARQMHHSMDITP
jgi:signal recognition particle subunit SRP72